MRLADSIKPRPGGPSRWQLTAIGLLCLLLLVMLILVIRWDPLGHRPLPDFAAIEDVAERKAAFFRFLQPYIDKANAEILQERAHLQKIRERLRIGPLNRRDDRWARAVAAAYGMDLEEEAPITEDLIDTLEYRVDIIPPSLALSQAALESGWGTSRFAKQGNNLFGIWCYEPGCGIVPRQRPAGATYEVASYRSPKESFRDYIRNLNSNRAYESLWQLRADHRRRGEPVTGLSLADGLFRYSEEGWTYIGKVQRVIQSNQLSQYDEAY